MVGTKIWNCEVFIPLAAGASGMESNDTRASRTSVGIGKMKKAGGSIAPSLFRNG
jgi:hypothetical protein